MAIAATLSALGIYRKDEKLKDVKRGQNRFIADERAKRKQNYAKSTEGLNEALTKIDPDSRNFVAPSRSYVPDEFATPIRTSNTVASDAEKAMENQANYELSQLGDALSEFDNASGLLVSIAPEIMKAQTTGAYGQGRTRAGQALLDYQLRNLQDQSYDQMGDILSQLGGIGMTYGLNQNAVT